MKKYYIILAMIFSLCVSIAGDCSAMTFNKPVKLGDVCNGSVKGEILYLHGYRSIGEIKKYSEKSYVKADAVFGDEKNSIHVFYNHERDAKRLLLGDGTIENCVEIGLPSIGYIYQITTDTDYVFYLIEDIYGPGGYGFDVIGRRPDGKFIKYITRDYLVKTYDVDTMLYPLWREHGLDVMISYNGRAYSPNRFVFKWDDKAQWFSIERI